MFSEMRLLKSSEMFLDASPMISRDFRPAVEWKRMTGMRDKLIHHYFGIDWEIVEDVLKNELPELRSIIS